MITRGLLLSLIGLLLASVPCFSETGAEAGARPVDAEIPNVYFGWATRFQAGDEGGGSLTVVEVTPGGPIDASGLRRGDVIGAMWFGGIDLLSPASLGDCPQAIDYYRALAVLEPDSPLRLERRSVDGEVDVVEVVPIAASPRRRAAMAEYLRKMERAGGEAVCAASDAPVSTDYARHLLETRVREKGALRLEIRRGESGEIEITSPGWSVPETLDLSEEPWIRQEAPGLAPGDSFSIDLTITPEGRLRARRVF